MFYKNAKQKELSDSSKNVFQEAKKLFVLTVEIYKKLVLEEENSKFEENALICLQHLNRKNLTIF